MERWRKREGKGEREILLQTFSAMQAYPENHSLKALSQSKPLGPVTVPNPKTGPGSPPRSPCRGRKRRHHYEKGGGTLGFCYETHKIPRLLPRRNI